jgi:hypothetical protein
VSNRAVPILSAGFAGALAVGALWVGLTAWTGTTYHLAPILAAAMPGVVIRARESLQAPSWTTLASFVLGVAAVAASWLAIVALDIEPTATIVEDQPGGVLGEVAAGALIGAILGAGLLLVPKQGPARRS